MEYQIVSNASKSQDVLELLTDQRLSVSIPVLCFICLMLLVGTLGNSMVIITYIKRVEKSSTNLFIFCLAVFDIINCTLTLPLEIYALVNPFTYKLDALCRFNKFVGRTADLSSGFIIVCISFDRYLRIARPHQGLSVEGSKIALCAISIFTVLLSSLTFVVYGSTPVTFKEYPDVIGHTCWHVYEKGESVLPLVFNSLILACFCIGVIILLTVYTLLGIKVRRWNEDRKNKKARVVRTSEYFSPTIISEETGSPDSPDAIQTETFSFIPPILDNSNDTQEMKTELSFKRPEFVRELSRSLDRNNFSKLDGDMHLNGTQTLPHRKSKTLKRASNVSVSRKASIAKLNDIKRKMKLSKTTIMFISATIAFVASHIPYACIKMAKTVNPALTDSMSALEYSLFLFAEYSFIVSYAVNPVIYSFLNPKYRRECRALLLDLSNTVKCHLYNQRAK